MHQWQTMWSISGPKLPETLIWFSPTTLIRPCNKDEANEDPHSIDPNFRLKVPNGLYVVHYPPNHLVRGSHRVQINVDAADEDEAIELATKSCERLTTSLSLAVSGTPYYAQLTKYRRADQNNEFWGWTPTTRISTLSEPTNLENADLRLGQTLAQIIQEDATANNSFLHLSTAWQLQSTSGSKPLQRSILQHYVLSMEAVVNGEMGKLRKEKKDSIRLQEQKFSKEFSESLPKRADKAKAIREASTKLRELSLSNMIPSIDAIQPILKLSDDICSDAKELYRFRSRNLSHPGTQTDDGMKKWLKSGPKTCDLCLADTVARTFLVKYCSKISKRAANSP